MTLDRALTVSATFVPVPRLWLTVARSGEGQGRVTSDPAGIDCGQRCRDRYADGTVVTLTATPAAGAVFIRWSGVCSGNGACTVTMTSQKSVTAEFGSGSAASGGSVVAGTLSTGTAGLTLTGQPSNLLSLSGDSSLTISQGLLLTVGSGSYATFTTGPASFVGSGSSLTMAQPAPCGVVSVLVTCTGPTLPLLLDANGLVRLTTAGGGSAIVSHHGGLADERRTRQSPRDRSVSRLHTWAAIRRAGSRVGADHQFGDPVVVPRVTGHDLVLPMECRAGDEEIGGRQALPLADEPRIQLTVEPGDGQRQ